MTAYMKKMAGIFMSTLKLVLVPNSSSLEWFSFSSVVNSWFSMSSNIISCYQLLPAVDSWWQLIWKFFDSNYHVHSKGGIGAKFQLSRLILIFINWYQLLTADESLYEKNSTGIFMYNLKLILEPNFSSISWISF